MRTILKNKLINPDYLPKGMFAKMLLASVGSVVGACLIGLAIFS